MGRRLIWLLWRLFSLSSVKGANCRQSALMQHVCTPVGLPAAAGGAEASRAADQQQQLQAAQSPGSWSGKLAKSGTIVCDLVCKEEPGTFHGGLLNLTAVERLLKLAFMF